MLYDVVLECEGDRIEKVVFQASGLRERSQIFMVAGVGFFNSRYRLSLAPPTALRAQNDPFSSPARGRNR
jgi:hypothetical protein